MSLDRASFDSFVGESSRLWHESEVNLALVASHRSTNELARRLVRDALADASERVDVLVCAFEQTAGRGRRGNAWSSPAGCGVYATLITACEEELALAGLPLAVGVALAEALGYFLPESDSCRLKWPNDLLIRGRKVGGVLIETLGEDPRFALIGFGVNVLGSAEELPAGATSLALEGVRGPSLACVAHRLGESIRGRLRGLRAGLDVAAEYAALSLHRPGDRIQFRYGSESVAGIFLGFGLQGALRLEIDGIERQFSAGEVIEE